MIYSGELSTEISMELDTHYCEELKQSLSFGNCLFRGVEERVHVIYSSLFCFVVIKRFLALAILRIRSGVKCQDCDKQDCSTDGTLLVRD